MKDSCDGSLTRLFLMIWTCQKNINNFQIKKNQFLIKLNKKKMLKKKRKKMKRKRRKRNKKNRKRRNKENRKKRKRR